MSLRIKLISASLQRSTFKLAVLSPSDRQRASDLIEQHLRLYLPSPFLASSVSSLAPAAPTVKVERVETAGPPSPKSLGDGLEDSLAGPSMQHGQDVDMADTQLHVDEGDAMGDTQVVEEEEEEDADEVLIVSVAGAEMASTHPAGRPSAVPLLAQ